MTKELPHPEPYFGSERHDVVLNSRFKPFEGANSFYNTLESKKQFVIPESYDYNLYLRRWISLSGIDGFIDVIDEDPTSIIDIFALMAKDIRCYNDTPLGSAEVHEIGLREGKWVNLQAPGMLRFSFLLESPSDYAKLLNTYADVELGEKKFFLTFNFNQQAVKKGMKILEEGEPILAVEKNLFDYEVLQRLGKESRNKRKAPPPKEDPGRISFITLPKDLAKLKKIAVTFRFGFDDEKHTIDPTQPNLQPLPILA